MRSSTILVCSAQHVNRSRIARFVFRSVFSLFCHCPEPGVSRTAKMCTPSCRTVPSRRRLPCRLTLSTVSSLPTCCAAWVRETATTAAFTYLMICLPHELSRCVQVTTRVSRVFNLLAPSSFSVFGVANGHHVGEFIAAGFKIGKCQRQRV